MIKKRIKQSISITIAGCGFISAGFTTYTDFLQNISQTDINIDQLQQQSTISRYDLARLLNLIECRDCIHPAQETVNKYNPEWWSSFVLLPDKDFRDIAYQGAEYKDESYYYCVAYAGDQQYMRGFPEATSPICGGQFCGANNITTAELIQVLINIASNYVYKNLELDRSTVKQRKDGLIPGEYKEKSLTPNMKVIIDQQAKSCPQGKCKLDKKEEVQIYLTYCTFNLAQCAMHSYPGIAQGARPVAELNLLEKVDILGEEELGTINIHELPTAEKVLRILYRVFGIVDCRFNNDYDCDGLDNAQDNCPNQYNPSQNDFDHDRKGDVCDDDTDNDGINNPIGIIDDTNTINIRVANIGSGYDQCLFDTQNKSGCNNQTSYAGLAIQLTQKGDTITAQALSTLDPTTVQWEISDGAHYDGGKITHQFTKAGSFTIKAKQVGPNNTSLAQASVDIAGTSADQSIQLKQVTRQDNKAKLKVETQNNNSTIDWLINDQHYSKKADQEMTFQLTNKTPYQINASIYQDKKLQAIASSFLYKDEDKIIQSHIQSDTLTPELKKIANINTYYDGFETGDIVSIIRQVNQETLKEHSMNLKVPIDTLSQKIVTQTIILYNGLKLINRLTLDSQKPQKNTDSFASIIPQSLVLSKNEETQITVNSSGFDSTATLTQLRQTPEESTVIIDKVDTKTVINTSLYHNGPNRISHTIFKEQCKPLTSQATLIVTNNAICESFLQDPSLAGKYCDRDDDTIPDVCDDDIDGDGIKNLIGIILSDHKDCSISKDNINWGIIGKADSNQGFVGFNNLSCQLDNCPITPNPDQSDVNLDGQGDLCQNMINALQNGESIQLLSGDNHQFQEQGSNKKSDQDKDGITDDQDNCPTIPEEFNGYFDQDGCPELEDNPCQNEGIIIADPIDEDYCTFPYSDTCKCSGLSTQECCTQYQQDCNGKDDPGEDENQCSYPYGQECICEGLTQKQCCEKKGLDCKNENKCSGLSTQECCDQFGLECKDYCRFPYPNGCKCNGLTTQECCDQFDFDCPIDDPTGNCSFPYTGDCICVGLSQAQCCSQFNINCTIDDPGENDNNCADPYGAECLCFGLSQTKCCSQFGLNCDNGDYCTAPYPDNCNCSGLTTQECCDQFGFDCPIDDPTGNCSFPYTGDCICVGLSQTQCCSQFNINCTIDDPGENDNHCADPYGAECLCFGLSQTECCSQFGFDCGDNDYCQEPYPNNCNCSGLTTQECCDQFGFDCPIDDPTGNCSFPYTGDCICVGLSQTQCCSQFNINCTIDDPGENDNHCADPYGAECLCFGLSQTECCSQFGFDCGDNDYCQEPYPNNCNCSGLTTQECCDQFGFDCPIDDPTGNCSFPYTGDCICVGLSQTQCCSQFNINCTIDDPGENDNHCADPYGAECLCFSLSQTECCSQFGFDCHSNTGNNTLPNDDIADNYITPIACNECPCQYADFLNDLQKNNLVKTILRDINKSIIYNQSESFSYSR